MASARLGRYVYFRESTYQDISVKGEYSPITNPISLLSALPSTLFKNSIDGNYPDPLSINYTDVEFTVEPNKITLDEITLTLLYMVPYTIYVAKNKTLGTSLQGVNSSAPVTFDKEDILLDVNNIAHRDILFELTDDSIEYIIAPQPSDWQLLLVYMQKKARGD